MKLISCLDLSEVPDYARHDYASEVAVCLKEILDRVELPPPEEIPGTEDVEDNDGGQPLVRWQIPNTQITIARVAEGPRRGEYLFTSGTVKRVPDLYEKAKEHPYRTEDREFSEGFHDWYLSTPANPTVAVWIEQLPGWFRNRFFGLTLWQWSGLAFTVLVALR